MTRVKLTPSNKCPINIERAVVAAPTFFRFPLSNVRGIEATPPLLKQTNHVVLSYRVFIIFLLHTRPQCCDRRINGVVINLVMEHESHLIVANRQRPDFM